MPSYVITAIAISVVSSVLIGIAGAAVTVFVSKHLTDYRLKELEEWKARHITEFNEFRNSITTLIADVKWIKARLGSKTDDDSQQ